MLFSLPLWFLLNFSDFLSFIHAYISFFPLLCRGGIWTTRGLHGFFENRRVGTNPQKHRIEISNAKGLESAHYTLYDMHTEAVIGMAESPAQRRANVKYKREKCDLFKVMTPKGKHAAYKQAAVEFGMSLSRLVQAGVEEYIRNHAGKTE